jgi:phage terminase large subunit-like protein
VTGLSNLSLDQKKDLLQSLQELDNRLKYNKALTYFPESGPLGRDKFKKHIEFLNAGGKYLERCFIGGNRSGKTETAMFEAYLHATGDYDKHPWFTGMKFHPTENITIWLAGISHESVANTQQAKLFGPRNALGTGLIPKDRIVEVRSKPGIPGAFSEVVVRRSGGGLASIFFMSFVQGREAFQAQAVHFIALDEEFDHDIYEECVLRLATTNGRIIVTFTPLSKLTKTVLHFLPNAKLPKNGEVPGLSAYVVNVRWEDVPLAMFPQEMRDQMEATITAEQRDARINGLPSVGSGRVYPFADSQVVCNPFKVPANWKKLYALDIGYNCTAAVFLAIDPVTDTVYVYDEYYAERQLPVIHVESIKAKGGHWMQGVIDPSAMQTSKHDGLTSFKVYRDLGLDVRLADNRVHAGILEVTNRMATSRLKIMSHCSNTIEEFRLYRYETNKNTGETQVAKKQEDHAMDALRYGIMALSIAEIYREPDDLPKKFKRLENHNKNHVTGY